MKNRMALKLTTQSLIKSPWPWCSAAHQPSSPTQTLTTKTHPINKEAKISVKHSPCSASNDVDPRPPQGLLARQIALVICTVWIIMVFQVPLNYSSLSPFLSLILGFIIYAHDWTYCTYIASAICCIMVQFTTVPYQPAWGSKFTNQLVSPKPNQPLAWKPNFFFAKLLQWP